LPQVHVAGAPPSLVSRCATAFLNAATIAAWAFAGPLPFGPANAALDGSLSVQVSRSSSSGASPEIPSPKKSLLTGTLPTRHQCAKTVSRYEPWNVHHSDAAAESWLISPFQSCSSAAACLSVPARLPLLNAWLIAGSSRCANG